MTPVTSTRTGKKPPIKRYTAADREYIERVYGKKGDMFKGFLMRLNFGIRYH